MHPYMQIIITYTNIIYQPPILIRNQKIIWNKNFHWSLGIGTHNQHLFWVLEFHFVKFRLEWLIAISVCSQIPLRNMSLHFFLLLRVASFVFLFLGLNFDIIDPLLKTCWVNGRLVRLFLSLHLSGSFLLHIGCILFKALLCFLSFILNGAHLPAMI